MDDLSSNKDLENVLAGEDAYQLYLKGKEAWNAWAHKHHGWRVDFSDWTFKAGVDFSGFIFPGDVNFSQAQFGDGDVSFSRAQFGDGDVSFSRARFGYGDVDFRNAKFGKGSLDFKNIQFGEGSVSFNNVLFGSGDVDFEYTRFSKGFINFSNAKFGDGNVFFNDAKFGEGSVSFSKAQFGKGNVSFIDARFDEGNVSFIEVQFGDGNVSFSNVQFGDGDVDFRNTKFGEGSVSFIDARFDEGSVHFNDIQFSKGDVNFEKSQFIEGDVNFSGSEFGEGNVFFNNTNFGKGNVYFKNVQFGEGSVNFIGSVFEGSAIFDGVDMGRNRDYLTTVSFNNATFEKDLSFNLAKFHRVPDLLNVFIGRDISMVSSEVSYKTKKHFMFLYKAEDKLDSIRFRKLKKLASDAKDYQKEIDFFAFEQRAKYGHVLNGFQYFPIFIYGFISNFGRSIVLPMVALFVLWILCAVVFWWQSCKKDIVEALIFSSSHILPIISWSKVVKEHYLNILYGTHTGELNWVIHLTAYFEGIFSLVLIFLIGLAVRNKLRI